MKKNLWIFALIMLLISSLACNAITRSAKPTETEAAPNSGGGVATEAMDATEVPSGENTPEAMPTAAGTAPTGFDTEFPLPSDVSNFTSMGNGGINFQTKMSMKDAIAFYRDAFSTAGYKERGINTAISDTTFSMVFDGHSSGKAIVIQGVDMGNGTTNINIRFEDL